MQFTNYNPQHLLQRNEHNFGFLNWAICLLTCFLKETTQANTAAIFRFDKTKEKRRAVILIEK